MNKRSNWLDQPSIEIPLGLKASGRVRPPSSKSVSHRMMNLTMLWQGAATIEHLLEAEDLNLFCEAFRSCGWSVKGDAEHLELRPPEGLAAGSSEGTLEDPVEIYCGNAGTMFRFMVATRCAVGGVSIVDGTPRLRERPIGPLVVALSALGAEIEFLGQPGCAPLRIQGRSLFGGKTSIDAGESSQYLSALLMACGVLAEPSEIEVQSLVSSPYVDVTLAAIERFGLPRPRCEGSTWRVAPADSVRTVAGSRQSEERHLEVEADYSAAAYPAAAAMISGGAVEIFGLNPESEQGDRKFLGVLCAAGGEMEWADSSLWFSGSPQRALDVDLGDMPDQVPTLAAVAAFCPGTTVIRNVAHLRIKESDRLQAVAQEWNKLGIVVRETSDGLEIEGRPELLHDADALEHVAVETYDDHRIAMSLALVGLRRPVTVKDPGVVSKSYPGFWTDFFSLLG